MVNVKPEQFQKIWSALITPTNEDESVNYEALERIVELQIQDGAEGFYCCGSSGEGLLLTLEERKQVLEHVLKAADGRVPVISHVGTIRTRDVVDLARHAMSAGALAVSMIPPYYYKFSMDEIMGYYEDVIRAIPDVPAIVYNIPQFTGVEFSKENAGRLLSNENIVGIKHTSTNLYSLERMGQAFPGKALINGFDEQLLGALAMGSCATIGTTVNLFAPLFHRVRDAFDRGDMAQAYRWQHAPGGGDGEAGHFQRYEIRLDPAGGGLRLLPRPLPAPGRSGQGEDGPADGPAPGAGMSSRPVRFVS